MDLFATYEPHDHGTPLVGLGVREATDADLPSIAALMSAREGSSVAAWVERLRGFRERGDLIVVGTCDDDVVGYGRLAHLTPQALGGRNAPDGLYLSGMIVDPAHRRRGVGRALTAERCRLAAERGRDVYFVVNARNQASMDLHRELGFYEIARDFDFPGITFTGGGGVLFKRDASGQRHDVVQLRVGAAR